MQPQEVQTITLTVVGNDCPEGVGSFMSSTGFATVGGASGTSWLGATNIVAIIAMVVIVLASYGYVARKK
jgi:hypothetical protein